MVYKQHFTELEQEHNLKILPVNDENEIIHIRTIQVKGTDPSNLTMAILKEESRIHRKGNIFRIPLVDFRTSFHKEGEMFILDVRNLMRFHDDNLYRLVKVWFESSGQEKKIDVEIFYTMEDFTKFNDHLDLLRRETYVKDLITN